jgi:hypothetical protein
MSPPAGLVRANAVFGVLSISILSTAGTHQTK